MCSKTKLDGALKLKKLNKTQMKSKLLVFIQISWSQEVKFLANGARRLQDLHGSKTTITKAK